MHSDNLWVVDWNPLKNALVWPPIARRVPRSFALIAAPRLSSPTSGHPFSPIWASAPRAKYMRPRRACSTRDCSVASHATNPYFVGSHYSSAVPGLVPNIVPAPSVTFVSQLWRVHCACGRHIYSGANVSVHRRRTLCAVRCDALFNAFIFPDFHACKSK